MSAAARRLAAAGLSASMCMLVHSEARANPLVTYGFGSRETAMGSAMTADARGFTAVFYNPGALALSEGLDLGVGYLHVAQRLRINGNDNQVDPVRGIVGGVAASGKLFGVPFGFGVGVHLPDDRLSRVRTLRQEIPRWELYDNRAQILFVASTVAVRPLPWLSLGGGIAYLSSTRGSFGITGTANLKEPYDSQLRHEVDADLTSVRIPIGGVRIEPSDKVSLGVTYRGESKLDLALTADIKGQIDPGTINIRVPVRYVLSSKSFDAFHPRQVAFGSSFHPCPCFRVNLDFVFTQWSAYQSATSRSTAHLDVDVMGLPIAIPPDPKPTVVRDPGFRDTLVPRLGFEWKPLRRQVVELAVRLGYAYERSPVPPQVGPTNFVDSDRHTVSTGLGLRLIAPTAVLPGDVRLDLHAARSMLPERETVKRNPADYVGDYRAEGEQTNVGATLGVGF